MDPFNQVYSDALGQMSMAENLLEKFENDPANFHVEDLSNVIQELVETIHDLSQSTGAVQSRPQDFGLTAGDVQNRISQVGNLNRQLNDLQEKVIELRAANTSTSRDHLFSDQQAYNPATAPTEEPAAIPSNTTSSLLYQQEISNQDNILDSVYNTVNNLNQQAHIMSNELAEQSVMIEDFDRQVDTAQDRLKRGMKKVDWVLKNNQETLSSCCISLLIVVLIVLLVLVIVL